MKSYSQNRKFTKEEDMQLRQLVSNYGFSSWEIIAKFIPTHTARQLRDRFTNYLVPGISHHAWTLEEDLKLTEKYKQFGPKWTMLSQFFYGRTPNSIKNRWNSYLSKQFKSCSIKLDKQFDNESVNLKENTINTLPNEVITTNDDNLFEFDNYEFQDYNDNMNFIELF